MAAEKPACLMHTLDVNHVLAHLSVLQAADKVQGAADARGCDGSDVNINLLFGCLFSVQRGSRAPEIKEQSTHAHVNKHTKTELLRSLIVLAVSAGPVPPSGSRLVYTNHNSTSPDRHAISKTGKMLPHTKKQTKKGGKKEKK